MKRFARTLLLIALAALTVLGFTGCSALDGLGGTTEPEVTAPPMTAELFADYDSVYVLYNDIAFTDTLETITARHGEPEAVETANGFNYNWYTEDGYGVTCAFHESGELLVKVVYYEDIRQFSKLSLSSNLSIVENFDKEVTFQECMTLFGGRPIEIAQIKSDVAGSEISRVYTWIDSAENMVQIHFNANGTIEAVSYSVDN